MRIAIDASNIRAGGGLTHLVEILTALNPKEHEIDKIVLFGSKNTLNALPNKNSYEFVCCNALNKNNVSSLLWQYLWLPKLLKESNCDILFAPGGILPFGLSIPAVTMSQNLLPFDKDALSLYNKNRVKEICRLKILKTLQSDSFKRSDGIIFLTNYAKQYVLNIVPRASNNTVVVPHGLNANFLNKPRYQHGPRKYSFEYPFKLIYVSIVSLYKHQWQVARSVAYLRNQGYPISIDFVGPPQLGMPLLNKVLSELDPSSNYMRFVGSIEYSKLPEIYKSADLFVFASSCETFGQILLEAMASGLPIACSNRSALPEILGDAGEYFDPENPIEIANAILNLFNSPVKRAFAAKNNYLNAQNYSWKVCAYDTFSFIKQVLELYDK